MIRKLLATTAIATMVATGAYAQTTTTQPPAATPDATAPAEAPVARAEGHIASQIIGESVFNGAGDDAQNIGKVNDLVLSNDGRVESIVVGVGGFLGIGEKNVAVGYDEIDWAERNGDRWIIVATTADALKELPAFDRRAYEPVAEGGATASNTTAPATTAAPAASDTAMAPAAPADTTTQPAGEDSAMTTDQPAGTDTTTTAAVDRSQLTTLPAAEMTADKLKGTTVYGADDANLGSIDEVVMTQDNKPDAVVIDVGGFLGIGAKPVAVGMDNLAFMTDPDGKTYLYTSLTKEQLEAQPEYNKDNWTAQRDEMRMTVPN